MAQESRRGPTQDHQGQSIRAICSECDRETIHSIVASCEYQSEYADGDFTMTSLDVYQVIECRGCQTISFRATHCDTENVNEDPDTGESELAVRVELYPSRVAGRQGIEHAFMLPYPVQQIYSETLAALRGSTPILAGIGIRALTEAVCEERGAKGANLKAKVEDLVSQGVVTRAGADTLHRLRDMGNRAAHDIFSASPADLALAFDVIEHALTGVYILPKLAENLP